MRLRRGLLVVAGLLAVVGLAATWLGRPGGAGVRLHLAWRLSPASNTVTVRLVAAPGMPGRRVLVRSRLAVSESGDRHVRRWPAGGSVVRVHVPPGRRTRLLVRVAGAQSLRGTLTVTAPPVLRLVASNRRPGRLLVSMSSPLRRQPHRPLCGRDKVSFPAPAQAAVAETAACRARLQLTGRDGERAVVPVAVPALPRTGHHSLPEVRLYCFAHAAGRAIYITIDDGWVPSAQVLAIMRRTHLPVTAFLIQEAARQHLGYWRAFVRAGGTIGDHTVSHPNLTTLTLGQATAQWGQARGALGRWLGHAPVIGRPPYGVFDRTVEAAASRAGLKALAGWSATVVGHHVQTWNGRPLQPGEIVILHWVPGLGHQLATLLRTIHARHLHPEPLTVASFGGIPPQPHSLSGD